MALSLVINVACLISAVERNKYYSIRNSIIANCVIMEFLSNKF